MRLLRGAQQIEIKGIATFLTIFETRMNILFVDDQSKDSSTQ